jgi:hypothetical protein
MSTIQVRNVPEQLHKQLKVRAALEGRSLSDYVLDELRIAADRPTMRQWLHDVDALPPPEDAPTPATSSLTNATGDASVADASAVADLRSGGGDSHQRFAPSLPVAELDVPEHFHVEGSQR